MTVGGALFLIALGLIFRYAIVDRMESVNLAALGSIMIWIGMIGLIIALVLHVLDAVRTRGGRRFGGGWGRRDDPYDDGYGPPPRRSLADRWRGRGRRPVDDRW